MPGTGDALYDANRLYGQVIYVNGLETDQPLAITRNHYADASATTGSVSYAVYAPFSIIPLWNNQGRADRAVIGGTAAPGQDYLCTDSGKTRCAYVYLDLGMFPYARSGAATGSWNGTVLVDKADATGTYYRRARTYDPSSARFTQEDPIGLAGGINEYGFASGDPANYSDPFGLCPTDMGGDGKTKTLKDCPQDSKGHRIYSSGAVSSPGLADPLLFLGGIDADEGAALASEVEAGAAEAYKIAASGGTNAGFLRNYLTKSAAELEAGIVSFEKNVGDHLNWIQNPVSKVGDFFSRSAEYQSGLLNKWKNDAVRNASQANILRKLLNGLQ